MSALFEKVKSTLLNLQGSRGAWIAIVFFSGLIALYWDLTDQPETSHSQTNVDYEAAATHIPAGYVLVPIEVANYESLDSILGQHGVVDLYAPSLTSQGRSIKVAERVKILRAPLNPSHFAVLTPEAESSRLVTHNGPFTVAVQNPNQFGTKFVKDPQSETETESVRAKDNVSEAHLSDAASIKNSQPPVKGHRNKSRITVEIKDVD